MTTPTLITTPAPLRVLRSVADLHRLAAEMRAHAAKTESVARVIQLGDRNYQLILRWRVESGAWSAERRSVKTNTLPASRSTLHQLLATGPGYRFPDAWLPELRAAFGVPDGTLMQFDLVKRVHQVVKWTWAEAGPEVEPLQMSLAGLEVEGPGENYYRGRG